MGKEKEIQKSRKAVHYSRRGIFLKQFSVSFKIYNWFIKSLSRIMMSGILIRLWLKYSSFGHISRYWIKTPIHKTENAIFPQNKKNKIK